MENEIPLIKFHTMQDPNPEPVELTPEQIDEETNPESFSDDAE